VHCVDPCGAGDRFAVAAAAALGEGLVTTEAVQTAVHRAAEYVAAGGPASLPPTRAPYDASRAPYGTSRASLDAGEFAERVRAQGGTVVATGGCFDLLHAGHVATLEAARRLGDCLVVLVNSDDSVRRLKGPARPLVPVADRVRVLEALECVDAVLVFDEDTPVEAIRQVRPHVWAKGGDYAGYEVPEARTLAEWGGQAVVLPYLQGRSTTALVQTAQTTRSSTREV
jgi:rfaE bifunctional protein nucleotidyltransferase chain/domain